MLRQLVGLVRVCSLLSSCSWILVNDPPPRPLPANYFVNCTDSRAIPTLDASAAVLFGLATLIGIGLVSESGDAEDKAIGYAAIGGIYGGLTLVFALSAANGFSKTGRCREMKMMMPPYYPYPPKYPPPYPPPYAPPPASPAAPPPPQTPPALPGR